MGAGLRIGCGDGLAGGIGEGLRSVEVAGEGKGVVEM